MDDAVGVRVIEGGGQHLGDVQCIGNRQQLLAEQVLLQIGAVNVVQYQEEHFSIAQWLVKAHDVRMLQRLHHMRFLAEIILKRSVECEIGAQHFQGHRRLSVGVRDQIHLGHGAGAKLALHDVAAAG